MKICCISSVEEANLAVKFGASAVGLVSEMPSGPGVISEELIAEITQHVPPGVSSFLLTCKEDADSIIKQQKRTGANTIQLCDRVEPGAYKILKGALPGISIVQVIHVTGEESIDEAVKVSEHVNGILLDSGNQSLEVKELGGTGRTHNWKISRKIVESVKVPVFLAGGLNPSNIQQAIEEVNPFGVDICSGVRCGGVLDEKKLRDFFDKVHIFL